MNGEGTRQRYLGNKGLVVFLAALSAFPALSTDLYLPALPVITTYYHVPEYQTNLTLILFFVVFAVSMLVWGPLSDRFGRKPVLLAGLVSYTAAGAFCALSGNVFQLMAFRVLQALGTGAASSIAMAVVKDVYRGRRREVILAVIQTMTVLSPAVAPMIGALILRFTSWRGAFVTQAVLGVLVLAGSVAYQETIPQKLTGSPFASLKRLVVVAKNRNFIILVLTFSLPGLAIMAFISGSSYIYQATFGLSEQSFSFFFALFAVSSAAGAQLYVILSRLLGRNVIITGSLLVSAVSGLLILVVGFRGPWAFILTFIPIPFAFSCSRPPVANLVLSQHEGDAGSVAGIMSATHMAVSSLGMVAVSFELWGRVETIGVLALGLSLLSLLLWLGISLPRVRSEND